MYLLDSNMLIDAKNKYYPFDVCPAFWEWLDRAHADDTVASVAKVHEELVKKDDELSEWVKTRRGFFLDPDHETIEAMRSAARWVVGDDRLYTAAARAEFLSKADYYLIGAAAALGATVVTNETSQPNSKGRVKIPDACAAMGVDHSTPFAMLRNEGVPFVTP